MSASPKRRRLRVNSESESSAGASSSPGSGRRGPGKLLNVSDHDSDERDEDDEDDGEDLLETVREDYKAMAELDRYDDAELGESDAEEISEEAKLEAERQLAMRDKQERRGRGPRSLLMSEDEYDDDDESGDERAAAARRRRRYQGAEEDDEERIPIEPLPMELENFDVPVRDFLERFEVKTTVRNRFDAFLRDFATEKDPRNRKYQQAIRDMVAHNYQSLHVSFRDLANHQTRLAILLCDAPQQILPLFNECATAMTVDLFPDYEQVHDKIFVRIDDHPTCESLRELRCTNLNQLIMVSGVVTRRTSVLPMLKLIRFKCSTCRSTTSPIPLTRERDMVAPDSCDFCGAVRALKFDSENTVYGNYQRITLQESPGSVPAGRIPRQKDVILLDDLIDSARPGEEVSVTGVYVSAVDRALNSQNGFPVFGTLIEANCVRLVEDVSNALKVTDEEKAELRRMASDRRVVDRLIASIAPSIFGHEQVKMALAMAMFGGVEKNVKDKHHIRGDINVLLLGDPGTAKSQCLKFVEKTAPRAVFTTGKGASAVGLTASVHKDPATREWTLEGGALVLADRGVCLIDEFDKMNDKDRTSIHEAMEQQSISISKAGIVTTLHARCSVIAAANPIGGRYDGQRSFAENVELTDPILQRFDILCVLQDTVDAVADERLAKFVISSHVRAHPGAASPDHPHNEFAPADAATMTLASGRRVPADYVIDKDTLRKYILYARSLRPEMSSSHLDVDKIVKVYATLRQESNASGGVPIAVRHAESMIRMAEAHARMHLREVVTMEDVDVSIRVMLESFTQAQRMSIKTSLRKSFSKFLTYKRDHQELLSYLLGETFRERAVYTKDGAEQVLCDDFERKAAELDVEQYLADFYEANAFRQGGFRVDGAMITRGGNDA